jgi:hypothetical protein
VKLLLVALTAILVSLPFGLCGDDSEVDPEDELNAVQAVLPLREGDPNNPPPIGQPHDCTLTPGRGLDQVQGSCLWEVEEQGDQFLVRHRQTWLCEKFAGDFPDYPPCDSQFGFHEWEYLVDLQNGAVEQIDERGQFPPDYIE